MYKLRIVYLQEMSCIIPLEISHVRKMFLVLSSQMSCYLKHFPFLCIVWYYTPECVWIDSYRRQAWISTSASLGIKSCSIYRFCTESARWECSGLSYIFWLTRFCFKHIWVNSVIPSVGAQGDVLTYVLILCIKGPQWRTRLLSCKFSFQITTYTFKRQLLHKQNINFASNED